jgi:hydrogenase maturation factor
VIVEPAGQECRVDPQSHCITCSDEGVAMRVVTADGANAVCADDERDLHDVAIDLVGPVSPGDAVLVHAGIAIRHLGVER